MYNNFSLKRKLEIAILKLWSGLSGITWKLKGKNSNTISILPPPN